MNRLLQHPNADKFDITAPVRSPEKAKLLEQLGVKAEIASLSDHDKIESLASRAHVIFNVVSPPSKEFMILKHTKRTVS